MSGQIETNDLMPEPAPYQRTPQAGEVEQRDFAAESKHAEEILNRPHQPNYQCTQCAKSPAEHTPAPAGDVEEQLNNILMALCARVERIPRGKTYGWSDEQKAIMALFAASQPLVCEYHGRNLGYCGECLDTSNETAVRAARQPQVVEGEVDIREILDALLAREHGADNDMTVEKAEQLLAACQQSADEVRREVAESLGIGGEMSHELACPAMIEFKSQNEWTDPISVFEYMCTCGAALVNQERARMRFVLKEQKHE